MSDMPTLLDTQIQTQIHSFTTDLVALIKRATLESIANAVDELGTHRARASQLAPPRELVPEPPPYEMTPARPPASPAKLARSRARRAAEAVSFARYERMAIERAIAECRGDVLAAAALLKMGKSSIYRRMKALGIASPTRGGTVAVASNDPLIASGAPVSLDAYEKAALTRAVSECGGNKLAAAKLLGVGKSTLYRMLTKHRVR
jgi:transcriptional regulator of acetoin/glycerol metabolism